MMLNRALYDEDWRNRYANKVRTRERALSKIAPGGRIFIGSGCGEPQYLVEGLTKFPKTSADAEILHILTLGVAPYTDAKFSSKFRPNAFFIGDNTREAVAEGRADYTPVFLSELPDLFLSRKIRLDAALIQVSPPDKHGFVSLGVSVDVTRSAVEAARYVIAEVNENMPRTMGYSFIHVDEIDALVDHSSKMIEYVSRPPDEMAMKIAKVVSKLIEDGSTIQIGIGAVPNAIYPALLEKNDLGVHTEMFSEWLMELTMRGVVTNKRKTLHPGKSVASFCLGNEALYDFIDNNPMVSFHPSEYTNDPYVIMQNQKMVAINTAVEIDLTGQVCSDSIGHNFYSGIGGQVDFIRGASRSEGGKAIITLASTTRDGKKSTIVPNLAPGAGVVTTRGTVRYIVTEWGYADLHGKSIRERTLSLINIAHPKFREWLLEEAKRLRYVYPDQILPRAIEYPEDLEAEGTFRNRKIKFRPISPNDEALFKDLFYSLSDESKYMRYFSQVRLMPREKLQEETNLDFETKLTIVAVTDDEDAEEMIGVGQYGVEPSTNEAEASFVVRDDWQEMGIGRTLVKMTVDAAKRRNLSGVSAYVLPQNRRMLSIFLDQGFKASYDSSEDAYFVKLEIE